MFLFSLVFSIYIYFFLNWDFRKSVACARPPKKKKTPLGRVFPTSHACSCFAVLFNQIHVYAVRHISIRK